MKKTILYILLFMSSPVFADEAEDKAEFKKLYAEFNELYANSEAIDPIIRMGEELYKLAPKAYGKDHMNTAVVTYNLASLYDEKGGMERNSDEQKAFDLYLEYFAILDKKKTPKDKAYFEQYRAMVIAEYNAKLHNTDKKYSESLLKIAEKLTLTNIERANLNYLIGKQRYDRRQYREASRLYSLAHKNYVSEYGENHVKSGELMFWLARTEINRKRNKTATENLIKAIEILDQFEDENSRAMVLIAHRSLVRIYSEDDEPDKATPHVLAFARKQPEDVEKPQPPLFEINPKFPSVVARKSSGTSVSVIVEYDIDENGFTTNISVHNSESDKVEEIVVNAIKKYRYVPLLRDGKFESINNNQKTFTYSVLY